MARIFTDGAETGDLSGLLTSTGLTVVTTKPRSGTYHYRAATSASQLIKSFSSLTELYFRSGMAVDSGSQSTNGFQFREGSIVHIAVYMNPAFRSVQVQRGTTTLVEVITGWTYQTWYLMEIYVRIHDTTGQVIVKWDGVEIINFTGDTRNGGAGTVNGLGSSSGGATTFWFDDFAFNDTSGGADNSWCGDGKIIALVPNGDNSVQWLGSDGDTTNNYALVDEIPPSGSDYVRATGSAYTDIYNLSTVDFAGQTIQRIWMVSRAKSDTSGDYFLHGIQVSGSNYLVTGSLPTSFGRIDVSATGTWALNPYTGGAWSQEQIDNLLLVIKAPG